MTTELSFSPSFSEGAIVFLQELSHEYPSGSLIYLDIQSGGTLEAQLSLSFVKSAPKDILTVSYSLTPTLTLCTASSCLPFIEGISFDYKEEGLGGELEIVAPALYGLEKEWSLLEKVRLFFSQNILPYLQQHKGHAELIEITQDRYLVLKFQGGCQGCSMAQVTLKQGIEQKVKEAFPQIQGVIDVTEHEKGSNPFA